MSGHRSGTTRGLSTAASLLVIFVGLVLAMSSLYTVTANTAERVADARQDGRDRQEAVAETSIEIASATWDIGTSNFTVAVNNTGDTTLRVSASDTVVDGTYVPISDYERVEVEGEDSGLWRPGEQLVLEDEDTITNFASAPDRVRFVTETGVAATSGVTDV